MRKIIFGLVLGISLTALVSAGVEVYTVNKSTANVETMQGVRIFTDSKPVMEYEYLGTVKMTIALSGKYSEVRDFLIKTAKKKYPDCEAVIINRGSADVIKFK